MRVALVYDRINKWGGAERVLLALHEIWPEAPLYTAVYHPRRAAWAKVFPHIIPSFLQYFPLAKTHHELYPWLTPLAFETFNFDQYDVVISVTSAEAKNIITKTQTLHVCYCLTPTRYLWSGFDQYQETPGWGIGDHLARWGLKKLGPTLKYWDKLASVRPDYYLAISQRIKQRIERYYERPVEAVIYPPVDLKKFKIQNSKFKIKDIDSYFLVVSRLVGHKRIDIIVEAFNQLGWELVVIGDGYQKGELKRHSQANIRFVDRHLTDSELVRYYQNCRALIHAAEEDFGLVAVEAQAAGKPVIGYGVGGLGEIILAGQTGLLFNKQTTEALVESLRQFNHQQFEGSSCRRNAERFSQEKFQTAMKSAIEQLYKRHKI